MKLIIQIPCLNEERTLPITLDSLPRALPGVDRIEVLVVDDASSDGTVEAARRWGVDHLVLFPNHQGLARAFLAGLDASLRLGADIIVNTDADNQYDARDLEHLIAPILEGRADVVVGTRSLSTIGHFSAIKKTLHHLGGRVMRRLSGLELRDFTSGFRAYSREGALRVSVFSRFTYTLETLIQAGKQNLAVAQVPVGVNTKLRESRLFPNLWFYLKRSASTMVRIYAMYEPLKFFSYAGTFVGSFGLFLLARFLFYYFTSAGPSGHLQSLLVGVTLIGIGVLIGLIGVVSDLMSANRQLLEDIRYRLRKMELQEAAERREAGGERELAGPVALPRRKP